MDERKSLALAATQFKLLETDSGLMSFTGYASSFLNLDSYGDTIMPGAYAGTLAEYGLPKMFFNHDISSIPVGKWVKAEEDKYGLLMTAEFTKGNHQAEEVYQAMKHGTVDGLSIGYQLKRGDFDETETGRTIRKVARLREVSVVTFPADSYARVQPGSMKFDGGLPDLSELENPLQVATYLHKQSGVDLALAVAVVERLMKMGQPIAAPVPVPEFDEKKMLEVLQRIARQ